MVKIHRIKKNASTTLALLEPILVSNSDIDIVVIREPIERFWSACKTIHPDIMFFDKVLTKYHGEIVKNNTAEVNLEAIIASCVTMAQETPPEPHFMRQIDAIGEKKFDYVFKHHEFNLKFKELTEANVISIDTTHKFYNVLEFVDFDNYKNFDISPKERDDAAMTIINNNHITLLNSLYEADILLYSNPSVLLK